MSNELKTWFEILKLTEHLPLLQTTDYTGAKYAVKCQIISQRTKNRHADEVIQDIYNEAYINIQLESTNVAKWVHVSVCVFNCWTPQFLEVCFCFLLPSNHLPVLLCCNFTACSLSCVVLHFAWILGTFVFAPPLYSPSYLVFPKHKRSQVSVCVCCVTSLLLCF